MLYEDGVPISVFFDKLTEHDERIHQHKIGDSSGQQTWEKLTVLIAVRAWKDYWLPRKAAITVISDNMSALALARPASLILYRVSWHSYIQLPHSFLGMWSTCPGSRTWLQTP